MHCERSFMEHKIPHSRRTPSFSSSLLDAIYRSIDESDGYDAANTTINGSMIEKQSNSCKSLDFSKEEKEEIDDRRRAMVIQNWVEKKRSYGGRTNSNSSSSDSCSGAMFSSSEAESYGTSSRSSKSEKTNQNINLTQPKFTKTKLKSLMIHDESKKANQPISPGARLTTFLNSIFNSNVKKVKICSFSAMEDVGFNRKSKSSSSSCSPASSFSTSCFSRKPSATTRGNRNNNDRIRTRNSATSDSKSKMKTSVTFYPLSMILDDDDDDDDYDDDDDAWSYASSDLFEVDLRIGTARYREELPVYGTTDLKTNRAIAKGLIL